MYARFQVLLVWDYIFHIFFNQCEMYKRIGLHMPSTQHNPLLVLCTCPIIVAADQLQPHSHPHSDGIKTPKWLC